MTLEEYRRLRSQKATPLPSQARVWSGKLNDARPGDVLRDNDGDVWIRTAEGAICLPLTGQGKLGEPIDWHAIDFGGDGGAEKCFGPFEGPPKSCLLPGFFSAAKLDGLPDGALLRDKEGDFYLKQEGEFWVSERFDGGWTVDRANVNPHYQPFTLIAYLTRG